MLIEEFKRNAVVRSLKRLFGIAVTVDDYQELWASNEPTISNEGEPRLPNSRVVAIRVASDLWRLELQNKQPYIGPYFTSSRYVRDEASSARFPNAQSTRMMIEMLQGIDNRNLDLQGHVSRATWPDKRPV